MRTVPRESDMNTENHLNIILIIDTTEAFSFTDVWLCASIEKNVQGRRKKCDNSRVIKW